MSKKIQLSYVGDKFNFRFETTQNCNDFEALRLLSNLIITRFPIVEKESQLFRVILTHGGPNKIGVIKAVRELTQLGLRYAKDLVDLCPKEIKSGVNAIEAEQIRKHINDAGGSVELRLMEAQPMSQTAQTTQSS